jgi:hypothetical protein
MSITIAYARTVSGPRPMHKSLPSFLFDLDAALPRILGDSAICTVA